MSLSFGSLFPLIKANNSKENDEVENSDQATWNEEDKRALEELKRALREYYNGENLSNRSRQLATLKMFGTWDEEDDNNDAPDNWEDEDVKAWRQFCQDMSCFEDDQIRQQKENRNRMYEQAEDEVATINATNLPGSTNIWPVAIVQSNFQMNEQKLDEIDVLNSPATPVGVGCSPTRKKKKKKHHNNNHHQKLNKKKTPHVDVVFVSQDRYRQAHGVEVMATPRDRVRDVYAGQRLAKF